MLTAQYVPSPIGGSCENGNKELSMSETLINIGVFNDDRATFNLGVKMWRGRAPAYIYLVTDGPVPLKAANCETLPIWSNKGLTTPFVDGLLQESVRDSGHANLALSAMVNAAETARQQGVDLTPSKPNESWPPLNSKPNTCRRTTPRRQKISPSTPILPGKSLTTNTTTGSATTCPRWPRFSSKTVQRGSITRWLGKL